MKKCEKKSKNVKKENVSNTNNRKNDLHLTTRSATLMFAVPIPFCAIHLNEPESALVTL